MSTRLRVRNKKPGESTMVAYKDGEVEKTHLVTFEIGDEPGYCLAVVPEPVACVLLQGSLYTRMAPEQKDVEPKSSKGPQPDTDREPEPKGETAPTEPTDESELTKIRGVGPRIAKKLEDAGFCTFKDLANAHENVLVQDCDVSESFAKKLVAAAKEML